jgi:HSP20 family protein
VAEATVNRRRIWYVERRWEAVRISDLIPWRRRKKKTKVPVKVEERPVPVAEHGSLCPPDELSPWFGLAPFGAFGGWAEVFGPRMDMLEDSDGFTLTIEVPGMDNDDIDVMLSQGRLTVRGERRGEEEHRGRNAYALHRSREAFRRSVVLPCRVDADAAEATLGRGVLIISLPKAEGRRGRRRISIRGR